MLIIEPVYKETIDLKGKNSFRKDLTIWDTTYSLVFRRSSYTSSLNIYLYINHGVPPVYHNIVRNSTMVLVQSEIRLTGVVEYDTFLDRWNINFVVSGGSFLLMDHTRGMFPC